MPSLAQTEVETVAWINFALIVLCIPIIGFYTCTTLETAENPGYFLLQERRGQELLQVLLKFLVFVAVWMPMSAMLKIAASQRNEGLLKIWSVSQIVLIFVVALHLLVHPPMSLMAVLTNGILFVYFITSLWLVKSLLDEIKNGIAAFASLDQEAFCPTALNGDSDNKSGSPENMEILMKKVVKKVLVV